MVKVPNDRTTKQSLRGYCYNPKCMQGDEKSIKAGRFEFSADQDNFACPKCGQDKPPMVGLLVLTHLIVSDPKGKIYSRTNGKFRMACDPSRDYIATKTNLEAGTDQVLLANCPGCLASEEAKAALTTRKFGA